MNSIRFFIHGVPKPGGSKRGFPIKRANGSWGVAMTDASGQAGKDWRGDVKAAALNALRTPDAPVPNPGAMLSLTVEFVMPRPKSHYRKDGSIKSGAESWHAKKPDTTKLLRSLEDALTGILWNDDSQIVRQMASKMYAGPDGRIGAEVTVEEVKGA